MVYLIWKALIFVAVHKDVVQKRKLHAEKHFIRYSVGKACENATLVSVYQYITY